MGFTRSSFNMKSFAVLALFCLASPALGKPQYGFAGFMNPAFYSDVPAGAPPAPASPVPNLLPEEWKPELLATMKLGLEIVENPIMDSQQFLNLYQQGKTLNALADTTLNVLENPTDSNNLAKVMEQSIDVISRMSSPPMWMSNMMNMFFQMFQNLPAGTFPQPSAGTAPATYGFNQV